MTGNRPTASTVRPVIHTFGLPTSRPPSSAHLPLLSNIPNKNGSSQHFTRPTFRPPPAVHLGSSSAGGTAAVQAPSPIPPTFEWSSTSGPLLVQSETSSKIPNISSTSGNIVQTSSPETITITGETSSEGFHHLPTTVPPDVSEGGKRPSNTPSATKCNTF